MDIIVPTSWKDVTVNQYQALTEIDKDKYKTDLGYSAAIIQVLCNLEGINDLPLSAVNDIAPLIKFLGDKPDQDKKDKIEINGVSYKWIESFNAITVGEAISVELPIELEELSVVLSYDVVLAVMLREEGKDFNASEFNKNRQLFGSLPITEVLGNILFFLNGGQKSTKHLEDYLIVPKIMSTSQRKKLNRWKRLRKKIKEVINGLTL